MTGEKTLQVRIVTQKRDFYRLREEWSCLANRIQTSIFQTHEWQYSWWECFGDQCDLLIITLRQGDQLVAVFPFFIDCSKCFGILKCKTLKLIGSITSNLVEGALPLKLSFGGYLDALIDPDYYEDCAREFVQIMNDKNLYFNNILLDELPRESLLLRMVSAREKFSYKYFTEEEASGCYQIILPESWEGYLNNLSKTTRKNVRRGLRVVNKKNTFEVRRASTMVEFEQMLQRMIELHQQRWNKAGEPGFFADKRVKQFYVNVCRALFKTRKAIINYCIKDDEVFAVELELRYKKVIYALQGSFDENSDFSKYSPSKILFYHSVQEGVEKGYHVYDWLRGMEEYKSSLSNKRIRNRRILYSRNKINFFLSEVYDSLKRHIQYEKEIFKTLSKRENGSIINIAKAYAIVVKNHLGG